MRHWRQAVVVAKAMSWVVEKLNIVIDFRSHFIPCFKNLSLNALCLQQREETFCNRIVVAIATAAHVRLQIVIAAVLGVLTAIRPTKLFEQQI